MLVVKAAVMVVTGVQAARQGEEGCSIMSSRYSRRPDVARVRRTAESGVASALRCMSTILATLLRFSRQGECVVNGM